MVLPSVLGEGGTSVWTLMMSSLARGLFHGAVDMSGSYLFNASLERAENDNLLFLRKTGCTDPACLRGLSVRQVLQVRRPKPPRNRNTEQKNPIPEHLLVALYNSSHY